MLQFIIGFVAGFLFCGVWAFWWWMGIAPKIQGLIDYQRTTEEGLEELKSQLRGFKEG